MMPNLPRRFAFACSLAMAVLLAACGGGGGGGSAGAASSTGSTGSSVTASGGGSGRPGAGSGGGGLTDATPTQNPSGGLGGFAPGATPDMSGTGAGGGTTVSVGGSAGSGSGATTGTSSGLPTVLAVSPSAGLGTGPRTLVLYDAPAGSQYERLGYSYAIMLRNLLGHFDARVDLVPIQQYTAGRMQGYDATFYLGSEYDNPLPASFLADAAATTGRLVWFKYNLWELANNPGYHFSDTRGIAFTGLRGLDGTPTAAKPNPGFFDTVHYKNLDFAKYYAYDAAHNVVNADPDLGITAVSDASKAATVVTISDSATGEQAPYVVRSGKFWYVADMPFSYIGPRDRYLVIADLLHDMLDIQHPESHRAMVRLEDIDAAVTYSTMTTLSDFLSSRGIPFSMAVIPHYLDPLGTANGGTPEDIPLAQATTLRRSMDYGLAHGGEVVMHGYTHQYAAVKNPWSGVSADDYEFWNIVMNSPVAEDSTAWALGRLNAGLSELTASGYHPVAWETPHYVASALTSKAVPSVFNTTYQRVVYFTSDQPDFTPHPAKDFMAGQIFPYVIQRDFYNQRVLPENCGNIEYDISKIDPSSNLSYTWQDIYTNARYALAVRDGFASFFFHPFWLERPIGTPGFADFQSLVDGITQLGYTWVAPSQVH